jgi:hypothetical protein
VKVFCVSFCHWIGSNLIGCPVQVWLATSCFFCPGLFWMFFTLQVGLSATYREGSENPKWLSAGPNWFLSQGWAHKQTNKQTNKPHFLMRKMNLFFFSIQYLFHLDLVNSTWKKTFLSTFIRCSTNQSNPNIGIVKREREGEKPSKENTAKNLEEILLFFNFFSGHKGRQASLQKGEVTCPSRQTLKCGGSPSWRPSLDHHRVDPLAAWVTSLSVGLSLTFGLTFVWVA